MSLMLIFSGCDGECRHKDLTTLDAVAPTCTVKGLTEGKQCNICGKIVMEMKVLDALGHTEVIDVEIAPTCSERGLAEGKHCSVCNEILIEQEVIPPSHLWNKGTVYSEPTCTEKGAKMIKCLECGEIKEVIIAAKGHDWNEATCTLPKKCKVCSEEGSALGHTTKQGICDRCNEFVTDQKRIEIEEENQRHQDLLDEINTTFDGSISAKESMADRLASEYGIYTVNSVSYHQNRVNSLLADYSNVLSRMQYASSYEQISLQRQLDSIEEDIEYQTGCVSVAEYYEEIEDLQWRKELAIEAAVELHIQNLEEIEAKYE